MLRSCLDHNLQHKAHSLKIANNHGEAAAIKKQVKEKSLATTSQMKPNRTKWIRMHRLTT